MADDDKAPAGHVDLDRPILVGPVATHPVRADRSHRDRRRLPVGVVRTYRGHRSNRAGGGEQSEVLVVRAVVGDLQYVGVEAGVAPE
jgi:hypothetical protein